MQDVWGILNCEVILGKANVATRTVEGKSCEEVREVPV